MERFINILVIDNDTENIKGLKQILLGGGNNLIFCQNEAAALPILKRRKIGIILLNIHNNLIKETNILQSLKKNSHAKNAFKIIICNDKISGTKLVQNFKDGAVDYISIPFKAKIVKEKINIFKSLHFKDLRINQLLQNIFPETVLQDLDTAGKFSPKKINEGVVLFADFVSFTKLAKYYKPLKLLEKLEKYFNKFDEIMERYQLEKIKTIGDAYMALAGVTETNKNPAVRATLAALEIRNFIINEKQLAKATNSHSWDIRIGLHAGPLVAGVIGSKKISYDVWGDTVNIAARAEQNSTENNITVTDQVSKHIAPYFDIIQRGKIEVKNGGFVNMYFVDKLKSKNSLFMEGSYPNRQLRIDCDLSPVDFELARKSIINRLKSSLPNYLDYHSINHPLSVEKAAERIASLEGIKGEDLILLRTAVLYHDSGFIVQYEDNEKYGIQLAKNELPKFGYNKEQIQIICDIIMATRNGANPNSLLQQIMCDADHDYLGRADYYTIAKSLRREMANYGKIMSETEWLNFQIHYLENVHCYYTQTSKNIRGKGKQKRIGELKAKKNRL